MDEINGYAKYEKLMADFVAGYIKPIYEAKNKNQNLPIQSNTFPRLQASEAVQKLKN